MTADESLRCIVRVLSAGDICEAGLPLAQPFEAASGPSGEDCCEYRSQRDFAGRPRCQCILNVAQQLRGGSGTAASVTYQPREPLGVVRVEASPALPNHPRRFSRPTPVGLRRDPGRNGGSTDARRLGWRMFVGGWSVSGMPSGSIERRRRELALADERRERTDPLKVWCGGEIESSRNEGSESGAGWRARRQPSRAAPCFGSWSLPPTAAMLWRITTMAAGRRLIGYHRAHAAKRGTERVQARLVRARIVKSGIRRSPGTMANDASCRRSQALSRRRAPAPRSSAPLAPTGERVRGCRGTVAAIGRGDAGRKWSGSASRCSRPAAA